MGFAFGHRELPFAIAEIDIAAHLALGQSLEHAIGIEGMFDHLNIMGAAIMRIFLRDENCSHAVHNNYVVSMP